MRKRRLETLLLGEDRRLSGAGVVLSLVAFLLVFADLTLGPELTVHATYVVLGSILLLAAAFAYHNEGLLVVVLLTVLPLYAILIELIHVGNTGPAPYSEAVVRALPFALVLGLGAGVIAGIGGLAVRALVRLLDERIEAVSRR